MEKISWTVKRRKADSIGCILRRNCLVIYVIERKIGGIEVAGRQRRKRKQPLYDLKEMKGYYKLKEESPGRTFWRTRYGRGCGHVLRHAMEGIKIKMRILRSHGG
jgi:hypothetical protein